MEECVLIYKVEVHFLYRCDKLKVEFEMEGLRPGQIAAEKGACMTGGTTFKVTVHGKMNHTGAPHLASDALMAAAKLVVKLVMKTKTNTTLTIRLFWLRTISTLLAMTS